MMVLPPKNYECFSKYVGKKREKMVANPFEKKGKPENKKKIYI